jgi:hypothetical protein
MSKTTVSAETIAAFQRVMEQWPSRAILPIGWKFCGQESRAIWRAQCGCENYKGRDGGGRFFGDYCNWDRIPEYRDFIFNSPAAETGRQLMGTKNGAAFPRACACEGGECGVATPWHQDQPYYCVDGNDTVSIWIPLDHVPRDRTLEFVGGSHKWGKYYRPERFDKTPLNENDGLEEVPDINGNRDKFNVIGWALEPATRWRSITKHCMGHLPITRQANSGVHFRCGSLVMTRVLRGVRALRRRRHFAV